MYLLAESQARVTAWTSRCRVHFFFFGEAKNLLDLLSTVLSNCMSSVVVKCLETCHGTGILLIEQKQFYYNYV